MWPLSRQRAKRAPIHHRAPRVSATMRGLPKIMQCFPTAGKHPLPPLLQVSMQVSMLVFFSSYSSFRVCTQFLINSDIRSEYSTPSLPLNEKKEGRHSTKHTTTHTNPHSRHTLAQCLVPRVSVPRPKPTKQDRGVAHAPFPCPPSPCPSRSSLPPFVSALPGSSGSNTKALSCASAQGARACPSKDQRPETQRRQVVRAV